MPSCSLRRQPDPSEKWHQPRHRARRGTGKRREHHRGVAGAFFVPPIGPAAPHLKIKSMLKNRITMTDTTEDLELFDDAKEAFPAKEDLKDRLVAIFVTGKTGQRKSEATGKMYDWVETITLVLDDGPDGTSFSDLVPSTSPDAPVVLDGFQWTPVGLTSRLLPRANAKNPRPMRGRINSRPNTKKGFSDSWSISEPTEGDKILSRKFNAKVAELMEDAKTRLAGGAPTSDDSAFD
jgi:hypothetical protein